MFNQIDAIVVPSIWLENSPLVIHEALEAGVLVITADAGGMKEYFHHEVGEFPENTDSRGAVYRTQAQAPCQSTGA